MRGIARHTVPDFSYERAWLDAHADGLVIGVDEAGRGSWAGAVVAGAAWINPDAVAELPAGLTDSKRLSAAQRWRMFAQLTALAEDAEKLVFATGAVSAADIDSCGIVPATFRAMELAVEALLPFLAKIFGASPLLLVDGPRAPDFADVFLGGKPLAKPVVKPVVRGDAKVLSIAVGALAAKCCRDQMMCALAETYPHYGWQNNKGYGTAEHQAGLKKHGISPYHRTSFRPIARFHPQHKESPA